MSTEAERRPSGPALDHDPPKRWRRRTSRARQGAQLAEACFVAAVLSLAAGTCAGIAWWAFRWVLSALP